jgi:hypothetical protein
MLCQQKKAVVKGLAKYVARFAEVIKVDEFRTSITCLL